MHTFLLQCIYIKLSVEGSCWHGNAWVIPPLTVVNYCGYCQASGTDDESCDDDPFKHPWLEGMSIMYSLAVVCSCDHSTMSLSVLHVIHPECCILRQRVVPIKGCIHMMP